MPHVAPALERRRPARDFQLQTMEAIYERASGRPDVPHRHDYYTVVLVAEAAGYHQIDYQAYPFRKKEVYFSAPGRPIR